MTRSPPTLSRDAWSSHPHWPQQVLLLGSHAKFRDVSQFLVDQAGRAGADWGWAAIENLLRRWVRNMRSHESYEEHKLYPYLAHRWGVNFARCQRGHVALHRAYDAVLEALGGGEAQPGAWTRLKATLHSHDEVLRAHLQLEEDTVVPALLEMEPDEFARYTSEPLQKLLHPPRRQ